MWSSVRASSAAVAPGLALAVVLAATAYAVAAAVPNGLASPLVLALLLGMALGAALRARAALAPTGAGAAAAAGPLLKIGVVALGARLDAGAVVQLGPTLLIGALLGAVVAFVSVEGAGRLLGIDPALRRLLAIGTAICGASAIVAAAPVCRARPEQVSLAIAAVSVLGTVGVFGFATWAALAATPAASFGPLAGATLQEVGQVLAAASAAGPASADLALLVKLARVALLGPALLALAMLVRTQPSGRAAAGARERAPALPPFVLAFLAVGAAVSFGLVPPGAADALAAAGAVLTTVAMAGLGLRVDLGAVRRAGPAALGLGAAGAVAITAAVWGYFVAVRV